jgi:predicted secreted protein
VYARNEVMAMSAKSSMGAVAAPATDAGTSRIRIAVSGEIQLQ